jgi:LmbE family N-acetylglucosaminyl deacetylase
MVFGPHPDDEALIASGIVRAAIARGDTVKVVVVTNGDVNGTAVGTTRQGESVAAMQLLGLTENDVIFFGYGDASLWQLYSSDGTTVIKSSAGQTSTYASRGLGRVDYHRYLTGASASYTRNNVISDFQAVISNFKPDEIYTVHPSDTHSDHQSVGLFAIEALAALKRSGTLAPKLYQSLVWQQGCSDNWPNVADFSPGLPFARPLCLSNTLLDWNRILRFPAPAEMRSADPSINLKARTIATYTSQQGFGNWLSSFARMDEFFWLTDFGVQIALTASVTASAEDIASGRTAAKAIDGIWDGRTSTEWSTGGAMAGSWIRLNWTSPVRIGEVVLHDPSDPNNNVLGGTLSFSDGSTIAVKALPPNGAAFPVTFAPKTVSWVRFTIDAAEGSTTGLAEIEVLGVPATSTAPLPPYFISGPAPAYDAIQSSISTTVSSAAYDLDGVALATSWSASAGTISGSGSSVTFNPPNVTGATFVAITEQVMDGRGGMAQNVGYVLVTPSSTVPGNLAWGTGVSASSQWLTQPCTAAVDGVTTNGAASDPTKQWVTQKELAGAWLQLDWPASTIVNQVKLYPQPSIGEDVQAARLLFSDGTSVQVGAVPGNGAPVTVNFPARSVRSMRYVIDQATGTATGLAEMEVFGSGTLGPPTLTGFNVSATTVQSTTALQGTVNVNTSPSPNGAVVQLTSNNPAVSVPATVTVPPGAFSATFAISTARVATLTQVDVTATLGTGSATRTLVLTVPFGPNLGPKASVTVSTENASAGQQGIKAIDGVIDGYPGDATREWATMGELAGAWIQLTWPATIPIAQVQLFDRPNLNDNVRAGRLLFSDGSSITVGTLPNAGLPGLTVNFATRNVSWVRFVVDQAVGSNIGLAEFQVFGPDNAPPFLSDFSLSTASIEGGMGLQGTVTIDHSPPNGAVVAISSANPAVVSPPAQVTLPAGTLSATFAISTATVGNLNQVNLTATLGNYSMTRTLGVTVHTGRNLALSSAVTVSSENATAGQLGIKAIDGVIDGYPGDATREWATVGQLAGAWIQLTWPAPVAVAQVQLYDRPNLSDNVQAGTLLFSDGSSVAVGTLPNAGATYPVNFTTRTVSWVKFRVDQAVGQNIGLAEMQVFEPNARVDSITVTPGSVTAGAAATGSITLQNSAPTSGTTLSLSSNSGAATVPATVTVPAGAYGVDFAIQTSPVQAATTATISAGFASGTRTTPLTVTPIVPSALSLSPPTVPGGANVQATVSISAPAPAGGFSVSISTSNLASTAVPSSVLVLAGATSVQFTVSTAAVSATTTATITASANGATVNAPVTLLPPNVALKSTATASSQNTANSQLASKAIDGFIDGYPGDYTREWASAGELAGAWIQLTWPSAVTLGQVKLYDRPNLTDNVTSGTLLFSDGSTVSVGTLPNNGAVLPVTFAARTVTWVRFRIDSAVGSNIGLAEFEAFAP